MFDTAGLRGEFPLFAGLAEPLHYLDNAATAQMHRSAFDDMRRHDLQARGNVLRGNHRLAEAATEAYEGARAKVASLLGAAADEVVFTSGTTAAINLVAGAMAPGIRPGDEIVVSRAEHHSNLLPWQALTGRGAVLRIAPLTADGRIDVAALPGLLGPRTKMVALAHAGNVTGALLEDAEIATLAAATHAVGAQVLLDGAQFVQHGLPNLATLGIDFYAFSGHKCFGPTGVGVFWGRAEALAALPPWQRGGGMVGRVGERECTWAPPPRRFEAGTPPIAQAVGLAAALEWFAGLDRAAVRGHEDALLRRLLAGLGTIPGLRLLGPAGSEERLPVVAFTLGQCHPHDVCQVLDGRGVALRGGHHCAQPLMEFFAVDAAVRASIALYNDADDIDALLSGLARAAEVLG